MSWGTDTALVAGTGQFPALLHSARPDMLICQMEGFAPAFEGGARLPFRVERLVPFLDALVDGGIRQVVFAGAMQRPRLDPELFDPKTATLVPRLLAAMQAGDDATLRAVIAIFEEWGLTVVGADAIAPDLVPGAGVLTGEVSAADRKDAERAAGIVAALGGVDVGQGAIVAQGLCLAVESLPGTDAMLAFAASHQGVRPDPSGAKGVFYKAPKPMQDRRIDLPVIGPQTVENAALAGLSGIAWEAGGVMLLDRAATLQAAQKHGLFLWAREP